MTRRGSVGALLGDFEDLAAGGALLRPHDREESRPLTEPRCMRESRADQRLELVAIELADVEFVGDAALVGVFDLVGARQHDKAVRAQHAHFVQECLLRGDVLDRLEGDDYIE